MSRTIARTVAPTTVPTASWELLGLALFVATTPSLTHRESAP